jgi:N-acyl-D-aspartate/D-glutamate deacylase
MYDILIKNGYLIDGTGNPWFKADIGVKDGRIAKVSRIQVHEGDRIIDAKGSVVTPGFVDMHSHSDSTILFHPRCENFVRQGVTCAVMGSCGTSIAPISSEYRDVVRRRLQLETNHPESVVVDWLTLEEFRSRVEKQGTAINFASHCGQNTIKNSVMGTERLGEDYMKLVTPSEDELEKMKKMVASAMEDGAFGMCNMLTDNTIYPEETIELCKIVARYGGIYDTHHRGNYGDTLIEGTKEAIMIAEKAKIPVNVSHHYAMFWWNWGKAAESMRLVDEARYRGVQITSDLYPWEYSMISNPIALFVPGGTMSQRVHMHMPPGLTTEKMLIDMADPQKWEAMKKELEEAYETEYIKNLEKKKLLLDHGIRIEDPLRLQFTQIITYSKTHPELIGKYFQEAADTLGLYWMDAVRKILIDDGGVTYSAVGGYREEDQVTVLKQSTTMIGSDGLVRDWPSPPLRPAHPRFYGTFARVLSRYVRDLKVIKLEDAIRKFTSLATQTLGLNDRGLLREGMWADVAIFDLQKIKPVGDYSNPSMYAEGMQYVLVNGDIVIDEGVHIGALPGKVLRHPSS